MKNKNMLLYILALCALVLGACATPPPVKEETPPPEPIPTENSLEFRAKSTYQNALELYAAGQYDAAQTQFQQALKLGLPNQEDTINAHKHIAFIACIENKKSDCRESFKLILSLDPNFELSKSEAGHPLWGPVYRSVKKEATDPVSNKRPPRSRSKK